MRSVVSVFLIVILLAPAFARAADPEPDPERKEETEKKPQAAPWAAYVLRRKEGLPGITSLRLPTKIPVLLVAKEDRLRPLIEVRMTYDRAGWTLLDQNGHAIKTQGPAEYRLFAYLNGKISQVPVTAKGPNGESEQEIVYIYAPEAQEFEVVSAWDRILLSSGFSGLNYFQSGFGNFRSVSLLLSGQYATSPDRPSRWGYYAGADITVLTMTESPSIGASPNLFEAKGDVSFRVTPANAKPLHVQILAGLNYLTMLSNGSPFGFSNLIAPDIGLRSRYILSKKTALLADLRYVPISHVTGFHDRGVDLSLSWSKILQNFHRLEYGLSFSTFNYQPDTTTTIQMNLLSLRLAYSI